MKKLLILLSLTLFLSQGGYSYSFNCPRLDLLPLPPYPPILTPPNFLDLTEDELNEFMKLEKENLLLQKEWEEIAEKNKIKRDRWMMGSETGEYDSEGNKHGFWTYRVPLNCGEQESGTYIHGKRQGEWNKHFGLTGVRSTYKDDKLHGLWSSGDFNGRKSGNYKNGKLDGKWTEYGVGISPGRAYWLEGNYKDGKKDGKWIFWHGNRKVHKEKEGNYKDDKKDGKWTTWYKNGQKKEEYNYKDGIPDGEWTSWFGNGLQSGKGSFKDGTGTFLQLDGNNQKSFGLIYEDGTGTHTEWFENGQIWSEKNYKDDKMDGKVTYWIKNGKKMREYNYKDGKLDGKRTYWYENGQISNVINYKDGKLDGNSSGWYKNGQITNVSNYKDGKLDGKWTYWYENGQIEYERNYKDNVCISGDC